MGLSLWLMPQEGPLRSKLRAIIDNVADAEKSPRFEPHMTIISIPSPETTPKVIDTLVPILQKYKDLRLQFDSLFVGSSYFVSVALALRKEPSLLAFQQDMMDALSTIPQKEFFPHISLYYGDTSAEERGRIASFIRTKGVVSGESGTTVCSAGYCLPDEVWVIETVGRPEEWKLVEAIKFPQ